MTIENKNDNMKIDMPEQENVEMPEMEELLKILIDLNMLQSQQSVSLLMNYMNDVEENFFSVLQELDSVKEQLAQIQNTPQTIEIHHTLSGLTGKMGDKVASLQEQLRGFRASLNEKAAQLVQNFKEHGVMALNNVCEFLGVKETMMQLKDSLLESAGDMQSSMDKIDKVGQELRETTTHAKNIGRAMTGKDTLEVPEAKENGFFHQMKRPYQSMKNFCNGQAGKLERAIDRIEKLGQSADRAAQKRAEQKPSIMEKLQSFKESQAGKEKIAPEAAKAKQKEASL